MEAKIHAPATLSPRGALAGLALSMLLSSLGTSITNVALPTFATAFDASFQEVQWVVVTYLLGVTASIVTVGRLGDLYGRRRLLVGGLLLFSGAAALSGLAPSLPLLLVARLAQGVGAAALMALTLAFVADIVPKERTGGAMGLLGTTSAIGTALGPSVGGVLTALLGWRAIFFVQVPFGLLALLFALRFLPEGRRGDERPAAGFDHRGTALLAATLTAWSLAATLGRGHFGLVNAACLGATALGAGLFVSVERRAASPLVPVSLLRDPGLGAGLAMSLLVSTVLMATLVVGPFYLSQTLGLGAGAVGGVMALGPLVAALTGVPAGALVDQLGTRRTTLAGLVGVSIGALALSLTPASLGVGGYIAPVLVITASYALFQAANNTGVLQGLPPARRGVVSGLLTLSRNLGLITGAAVMGAVFAAAGLHATFAVAAALVALALLIAVGGRTLASRALPVLLLCALAPEAQAGDDAGPLAEGGPSSLRFVGLVQVELTETWTDGAPASRAVQLNRARAGVTGTAFSEDLRYLLVADFGRDQVQLPYASLDYTALPSALSIRAGQFKRPFSRSFLSSASQLSMIDRPLPVGAFGDGSDIGLMLHNGVGQPLEYAAGIFSGRAPGSETTHPLLAVRLAGNTHGMTGYTEGDLEGGGPRLGLGGAAMFELGGDPGVPARGVLDLSFKAHGLAISSAVYLRGEAGPAGPRVEGFGHSTQIGYVIAERVEPVVRYAAVQALDGQAAAREIAAGLNLFLRDHALKLQSDGGVREEGHVSEVYLQSQISVAL